MLCAQGARQWGASSRGRGCCALKVRGRGEQQQGGEVLCAQGVRQHTAAGGGGDGSKQVCVHTESQSQRVVPAAMHPDLDD